jgi:tetratricopeptide (TPR) repeat protein
VDVTSAREVFDLARTVEAHVADDDADEWVDRLAQRIDDIQPAIDRLLESDDPESALDLAGALSVFWQDIGRVDEGRRITEQLLISIGDHPRTRALARAHLALGELAFRQGDQRVAMASTTTARAIAAELRDEWIVGRAELNLARVAFREGDAPLIFEHARRALDVAGDSSRLRSGATHMLAWAEYTAGNPQAAIEHFENNVALYRESGDRIGEASELANLADLAVESGDLDAASRYLSHAFAVRGVPDNRYLAPSLIRSVGVLVVLRGRHDLGLDLIAASERHYEDFGLVADPGDDLFERARRSAVDALGAEASAVELRGRGRTFEDAVSLAMKSV